MTEDGKLLAQLHDELKETNPDVFIVRQACQMLGIPEEHRPLIWQILLKQKNAPSDNIPDDYAKLDQPNQRVLTVSHSMHRSHGNRWSICTVGYQSRYRAYVASFATISRATSAS
jgi:hypothetical protein